MDPGARQHPTPSLGSNVGKMKINGISTIMADMRKLLDMRCTIGRSPGGPPRIAHLRLQYDRAFEPRSVYDSYRDSIAIQIQGQQDHSRSRMLIFPVMRDHCRIAREGSILGTSTDRETCEGV